MMQNAMRSLSPSATDMIRMDHTHVNATFHRYKAETDPQTKQALAEMIFMALEVHATIEEEIFYPAMREVQADRPVVDKSYPEHAELKRLIAKLREMQPTDPLYDKLFLDLMRDVLHHVADEETTLLPDAEAAREVTGYERGTITPFGAASALPVIADERIVGRTISIGAGAHGVAATVAADDVIAHLAAQVADVTDPA